MPELRRLEQVPYGEEWPVAGSGTSRPPSSPVSRDKTAGTRTRMSKMRAQSGSCSTKRRRLIDSAEDLEDTGVDESTEYTDDDEDTEDGEDGETEQALQPEAAQDEAQGQTKDNDGCKTRLVLLTVKTLNSTVVRFAISDHIIRLIPEYAKKLDAISKQTAEGKRLRIVDNKVRKEEAMIQTIEYLTDGILGSIDTGKPKACLEGFYNLLDLYDLSVTLKIQQLEVAVIELISQYRDALNVPLFIRFASECYRAGRGHKVTEGCPIGQFIKAYIAQHLQFLIETGAIDDIKNLGGTLNKQLVEVFTENFVETQKRQQREHGKGKAVKIETND